mgnify:CR=1 FL=1
MAPQRPYQNGQFGSTEFNPMEEENWWDGRTTDPNNIPSQLPPAPITPLEAIGSPTEVLPANYMQGTSSEFGEGVEGAGPYELGVGGQPLDAVPPTFEEIYGVGAPSQPAPPVIETPVATSSPWPVAPPPVMPQLMPPLAPVAPLTPGETFPDAEYPVFAGGLTPGPPETPPTLPLLTPEIPPLAPPLAPPTIPSLNVPAAEVSPEAVGDQPLSTAQVQLLLDQLSARENVLPGQTPAWKGVATTPVGMDPLSQLAGANLATMMQTGGVAPTPLAAETERTLGGVLSSRGRGAAQPTRLGLDVQRELQELMARGGAMPEDQRRQAMELETARGPLDRLRRAQLAQGSAEMARRGTLGMGTEADFRERLEGRLAPMYAEAGQQLELAQRDRENQRYMDAVRMGESMSTQQAAQREQQLSTAMQLATGMSQEQSRNVLNTVQTVNQRQQMLNEIALGSLDRNMEWNKFLAEFGLDRVRVANDIQQGRFDAILPILQTYLRGIQTAAGGYVPA